MISTAQLSTLGEPLPSDDHVSVSLPTWSSIIGYELGDTTVTSRMKMGYPRFLFHPKILELFNNLLCGKNGMSSMVFLNISCAHECVQYIHSKTGYKSQLEVLEMIGLKFYNVFFSLEVRNVAKEFWQHTGTGVSSRFAHVVLSNNREYYADTMANDHEIKDLVKKRLSSLLESDYIYLFPSGMAAIYQALKLVWAEFPDLKTVQFGFPYTDTLRLQEKFGFGCEFFGFGDLKDLQKLRKILQTGERLSALVCEFPSNPLLQCVDLEEIRKLADEFNFLVIIDDTIGSLVNVDILRFSDILVTSLTKTFSGTGNVMAGSLVLNPNSKHFNVLYKRIDTSFEDALWCQDAAVLELNSRDFEKRVLNSSRSAEQIVDFLIKHPKVDKIFYPKYTGGEVYRKFVRNVGSSAYGSLFSIVFNSEKNAVAFYDNLDLPKGPSLGTNFSLICPYTLLAHFQELEKVSEYGVSAHLLRFSVGLENPNDIIQKISEALEL